MQGLWGDAVDLDADGRPVGASCRRVSAWLLVALLAAALVPRALMAWRLSSYCNDAYLYFFIADGLDRGDQGPLASNLGLNVYPFALQAVHALGLSWGTAGEAWGVLATSLVVLPLFGWVRRIFDERVALVACFLYCIHPVFIEIGVEPIRDGTFWLLASLALYCAARAREDARPVWFVLLAMTLTLTVRTRSEGWLLLVPGGMWLAGTWFRRRELRFPLAVGAVLFMVAVPATDAGLCAVLWKGGSGWDAGPLRHFRTAAAWLTDSQADPVAEVPAGPSAVQPATAPVAGSPCCVVPRDERLGAFVQNLLRTFTPPNLLFLVAGFCVCGRTLLRWERAGLVLFAACLLSAVWLLLSMHSVTNSRYFLSAVLLLLPVQAVGLVPVVRWIATHRLPRWRGWIPDWQVAAMTVAGLAIYGLADAISSHHSSRQAELDIAAMIRAESGPRAAVVCDHDGKRIGYHIAETAPFVLGNAADLDRRLAQQPPEWLVISSQYLRRHGRPAWWGNPAGIGYREVPAEPLEHAHCAFRLLRRIAPPVALRTAGARTSRDRL